MILLITWLVAIATVVLAYVIAGIALAFLIGGLVATGLLVTRRKGRRDAIPFGPALVAGALVAVAVGQELADWYTRAG